MDDLCDNLIKLMLVGVMFSAAIFLLCIAYRVLIIPACGA